MRRLLFFIVYALVLRLCMPGSLLAHAHDFIYNPGVVREAVLILCSLAICGLFIFLAGRLYRYFRLHESTETPEWWARRHTTIPFPGSAPRQKRENKSYLHSFRYGTFILLLLFFKTGFGRYGLTEHLRHGYKLSADISYLLGTKADNFTLRMFCNNRPQQTHDEATRTQAIIWLLEHGADPNHRDFTSAIEMCLYPGNQHLLPLMLEHGGKLHGPDGFMGIPPAGVAARLKDPGLLRYVLNHGADANAKAVDYHPGASPLHCAVAESPSPTGHAAVKECVQLLLDAGADVNALDARGRTPLDTMSRPQGEIGQMLRAHGALSNLEFPISLRADEHNLTAKLQNANPNLQDTDMQGIIDMGRFILYSYSQTGKGNGFITVPGPEGGLHIRCYDSHDDGTIYKDGWAQITLETWGPDQYRDIVVRYTELDTDEEGQITSSRERIEVYHYSPESGSFSSP
ncbi:MAG: hypothetical protein UHH87_07525 [Akkermansia sp.]|nr:hypothetical protein [Akkermansia sp.]